MCDADFVTKLAGRRETLVGFTLAEILVVVAIIALLLAILLPSLSGAREKARTVVCGAHLHQLSLAAAAYAAESHGWFVGSPNTSGNGARPGWEKDDYTDTYDWNHYPALQWFDWANPLLPLMGVSPPRDFMRRYAAAVNEVPNCPSNRRRPGPVRYPALEALIPADSLAPSYATSRYFMCVGTKAKTGKACGTLYFDAECVPDNYVPKLDCLRRPSDKAFLADAHIVSKTKGEIFNSYWGFSSHGAWRSYDIAPSTYRGDFLHDQIWRHRGAINILAFDGHVELQREIDDDDGNNRPNNGYGDGARRITWWFPSGTQIEEELSPKPTKSEPSMIVP